MSGTAEDSDNDGVMKYVVNTTKKGKKKGNDQQSLSLDTIWNPI